MPETDEEIRLRLIVEAANAIENAQQFRAEIDTIKEQMKVLAAQSKTSFKDIAEGMKQTFAQKIMPTDPLAPKEAIQAAKAEITSYSKQVRVALSEVRREAGETSNAFGRLGNIGKFVFGSVLGFTAITVLRNLINGFKEAAKYGNEFLRATFSLEIGIRAIQRTGVDITIQDVYDNIDKLGKRFGVFSKKELVEGSAALINLTRDFGFTKEQIFELQESIATLAIVNGRAMDDVQRTVALAISSGYTEGLQRLGVSINKVTIAQKAQALGYADSYMALTEFQRAEATRILTMEKTAKYEEDALIRQERAAGATDKLKTAWSDFLLVMGERLARGTAGLAYFLASLLGISKEIDESANKYVAIGKVWEEIGNIAAYTGKAISLMKAAITGELGWAEALQQLQKFKEEWQQGLEDLEPTELDTIQDAVSKALEDWLDEQEKFTEKSEELELDYQRDLDKIDRDGERRRFELARDYYRRKLEIIRDAARDEAEENRKYAADVAQAQRQYTQRRAEMEARYRENELKAEIRFQEELRKLREGFLFDLEDALRERDARQVLRLIRQYNLQKEQATRQYEIEKDERKRAHQLELKELEAQRQERLRILAEEHAARLAAIQEQAAYEQELAKQRWEQEKRDLERRLKEQKAERWIRLQEQKEDLKNEREEILKQIGEDLWTQLRIDTEKGLADLYEALVDTLGEGGDAESVLNYYKAAMAEAAAAALANIGTISAAFKAAFAFANMTIGPSSYATSTSAPISTPVPPLPNDQVLLPGTAGSRQMGGEVRRGEIIWTGEEGPEPFIPAVNGRILSVKQSQEALAQAYAPGMAGRGEGMLKVLLSLSPDLVAEVIDQSLGQVSDVVFELDRRRR